LHSESRKLLPTSDGDAVIAAVQALGPAGIEREMQKLQGRLDTLTEPRSSAGRGGRAAELVVAHVGYDRVGTNKDVAPTRRPRDSTCDSARCRGRTWRLVARTPGRHRSYGVFHPNKEATIEVP